MGGEGGRVEAGFGLRDGGRNKGEEEKVKAVSLVLSVNRPEPSTLFPVKLARSGWCLIFCPLALPLLSFPCNCTSVLSWILVSSTSYSTLSNRLRSLCISHNKGCVWILVQTPLAKVLTLILFLFFCGPFFFFLPFFLRVALRFSPSSIGFTWISHYTKK